MATLRAQAGPLRRNAMNQQGALYDLLFNVCELMNRVTGSNLSLEGGSAPSRASGRVVALATATTLSEETHADRVLRLTGTGSSLAQTLPAATGSGARFYFVVGAVNTSNHVIKVTGDDILVGNIITNSTGDTPDLAQPWPTAADSDTITLNGTTTGGAKVADWIECIDAAADTWYIRGVTTSSGSEATPFSAGVP